MRWLLVSLALPLAVGQVSNPSAQECSVDNL